MIGGYQSAGQLGVQPDVPLPYLYSPDGSIGVIPNAHDGDQPAAPIPSVTPSDVINRGMRPPPMFRNASAQGNAMDPTQRDMMIQTVLGEAGNQGPLGQAAVAHVIRNRAIGGIGGQTPAQVVMAPNQFESWSGKGNQFDPSSKSYQDAGKIVDAVMSGAPDPTFGATNFINKGLQSADGRATPKWAAGPGLKIGDQLFYHADGSTPQPKGNGMSFTDGSTNAALPNGGNALQPPPAAGSGAAPVAPAPSAPGATPGAANGSQIMAALSALLKGQQGVPQQPQRTPLVSRALGGVGDAIGSAIGLGTAANPKSWFGPTAGAGGSSPIGSGLPGGQPGQMGLPGGAPGGPGGVGVGGLTPGSVQPPAAPPGGAAAQPPAMGGNQQSPIMALFARLFGGTGGGSGNPATPGA